MKDLDVNTATWWWFMSVTLQAAVHLGKGYTENMRSTKNQPKTFWRQLFQVTQSLITDQTEITGLTTIDWCGERRLCWLTKLSTRFKRWWLNQSVNWSNPKEGSSSCQCTTLIGKTEETEKIVLRMLPELLSVLEDSFEDIGHFSGLDEKKWFGTHAHNWRHDAQLCWKRTSYVPCDHCFGKRRIEKQRKKMKSIPLQL